VIVSEFIHDARIVRMNGLHSPAAVTSWLGDSVGWWEHDTLVYVFIVTDSTFYTRPWSGETHLLRSKDKIYEFACHEGHYWMRDMLEAARQ
jgi:hypothetical protein